MAAISRVAMAEALIAQMSSPMSRVMISWRVNRSLKMACQSWRRRPKRAK